MLVQCPSCHTTYRVSDSLITTANPTFRCSRCKHTFVLGLKTGVSPARETAPPTPTPPQQEDEPELSFSFPRQKKRDATEEQTTLVPSEPPLSEQTSVEKSTGPVQAETKKLATDESFSFPDDAPVPTTATEEPPPRLEKAQSPLRGMETEKEDNWSISAPGPQEESFTIPEESRTPQMANGAEPSPEFEDEWPDSLPLLSEEREPNSALDRYRDRPLSVVPYISLFGVLLLIYSLFTLMYQAQPKTIEAAMNTIPWLGPAVLKNNHLRHGITLQSLRPSFQTIQGNRKVFVLSGIAVNRHPISIREVRVEGQIFDAEGKEIDHQIISLGNAISSKIIRDLTAQEISILQKLNPQKRFEIPPDESAAFVIVFLKPSAEVKNFSCRVLSAEAGV